LVARLRSESANLASTYGRRLEDRRSEQNARSRVRRGTLSACAIDRQDRPILRSPTTRSTSTARRGRPTGFPDRVLPVAFTRPMPARTRSRINSRSNSASAASRCTSRRPVGVVKSIDSRREMTAQPAAFSSSSRTSRSLRQQLGARREAVLGRPGRLSKCGRIERSSSACFLLVDRDCRELPPAFLAAVPGRGSASPRTASASSALSSCSRIWWSAFASSARAPARRSRTAAIRHASRQKRIPVLTVPALVLASRAPQRAQDASAGTSRGSDLGGSTGACARVVGREGRFPA